MKRDSIVRETENIAKKFMQNKNKQKIAKLINLKKRINDLKRESNRLNVELEFYYSFDRFD
jgi:hypothetical protein